MSRYSIRGHYPVTAEQLQSYQMTVNPDAYAPLGAFQTFLDYCKHWGMNPLGVFACAMWESDNDLFNWRQTKESRGYLLRYQNGVKYFWKHFPFLEARGWDSVETFEFSNGEEGLGHEVADLIDEIVEVAELEDEEPEPVPEPTKPVMKPKEPILVPTPNPEPKPEPRPPESENSIWDKIWAFAKLFDSRIVWFVLGLIPGGAAVRPVLEMILEVLERLAQMFILFVIFSWILAQVLHLTVDI